MNKKIIYIISSSHSGSTLLSALLGAQPSVFCLGETDVFSAESKSMKPLTERQCSCGQGNYKECAFWQQIDQQLQKERKFTLADLDLSSAKPATFEEHHNAFWRVIDQAITDPIVVDSSKEVEGFAGLYQMGLPVVPIYLVRSPLGVIASEIKKGKSWWREAFGYLHYHMRARIALAATPHLKITYKELSTHPARTLRKIFQFAGHPIEAVELDWHAKTQHLLRGNGMIMRPSSAIVYDEKWRKVLSPYQQNVVLAITSPLRTHWLGFFKSYLSLHRGLKSLLRRLR